ncbi:hypothetical protein EU508_03600 [Pseudoalteromonas fuliginea]|uniref:DUF3313 domain-containing protein n=1 Tax=Pseudoalteromonas fuliginea TaxID=1872678 RepID=A0AB73BK71_9GAMM|nr:hypothetical protein [Pseudoalteromonas fuliginea]KAA1163651.1 hypothetical protein EU508_03600 [Pseudoalteromonas fuliginea]
MMKHIFIIIALLNLVGCKLIQYNSDPKVTANAITFAKPATHSNLAYIWLPTANTGNKALYREAFDNNVTNFSKKYTLTNLYPQAQTLFNDFVIGQGGAFNTKTGTLESERIQAAIQFTFNNIKQAYPNIDTLLVIHPKENSIKIVDGTATWNGVEQQVLTRSRNSVEFRPAISLVLQYYDDVEKNNFHEVGLDMHAPDLTDNNKYERILKHILSPIVLLNTKVK